MALDNSFNICIFTIAILTLVFSCFLKPENSQAKLVFLVAVLFGATLIVTGMLRLIPGDPVDHILGDQAPQHARIQLALDLGLIDQEGAKTGFITQYGRFIRQIFSNELLSYRTREPVFSTIFARLPYTLWLACFSLFFALLIGPLLGVLAAFKKHTWIDGLIMSFAVAGMSIPRFFLGPLLLLAFSIYFHWFPISGATDGIASVILPALSLGLALASIQTRMVRASILEIIDEDYIRTARSKGLAEQIVYLKHALRNALIPVITVVGLELGGLLTGTIVTEKIFSWPGIGLLLLESIQRLDMPLVQGIVLTIAFIFVSINFLTDYAYVLADPRIKIYRKN